MSNAVATPVLTETRAPQLGIARSIALCVVFYIVFVAALIPLELLERAVGLSWPRFSVFLIPQVVAWLLTIRLALQWSGTTFREACPMRPFPLRIVPPLLLASYGAVILLLEIAGWIPMPDAWREALKQQFADSHWLMFLLPVVVVAPVAEELFFRGLLLKGYLGRYSVTTAIWVSAIMFALFHLNPWQAVVALPLGVGYAWLLLRTGSVLPSMLSHAMVNFSTNFLLQPFASALGYSAEDLADAAHFPPIMLGTGVVLTVAGCGVLWRQLGDVTKADVSAPVPPTVIPLPNENHDRSAATATSAGENRED
jgi:membrane protease YdiL (CAAX protease family)